MSLFSKLGDIKEMKSQAQAMQAMLAQEKVTTEYKGISITMDGNQEILDVQVSDEAFNNKEEFAANLKTALADSIKKVQRLMATKLGGMM
ncbi:MAG: YbaB/EbfC family nucleoid-associated protein [Candidatus Komeilibacteria bacterium]